MMRQPTGLMRWLFRAPILLYRMHLGWLLGGRFLLLHHRGRKSGLARMAVVEVVRHDKESDTYIIASGFGDKAQWFKNLLQTPDITIQTGRRTLDVRARRLMLPEATAELQRYGQDHPRAAKELGRFLGLDWDGTPAQAPAVAAQVPVLALAPRQPDSPEQPFG